MENFWPTTANSWLTFIFAISTLFGSTFGAFGYLLNKYVTKPINDMRDEMREMRTSHSERLAQHDLRISVLEKENKR